MAPTTRRATWRALALATLLAAPLPSAASDAADDEWGFSIAPYAWLLAIDGELGVNGGTAEVDMPFSDIWDDLDFTLMGEIEARRGPLMASLDTQISELGPDTRFGPTNVRAKADVWMTTTKLLAGYRVLSLPVFGTDDDRRFSVDGLAGARLWTLDTDLKLEFPILGTRRLSADDWWVDPVLGTRLRTDLTDHLLLTIAGNIGGFDWGSASRFSWEAIGYLAYRIGEHWSLAAGYRAIGVDRERGPDGFDGTLEGPFLGFGYAWGAGTR